MAEAPRQPPPYLGRAIRRTDAERAEAARITPIDIANGRILNYETMPYPFGALIDAKVDTSREEA